MYSNSSTLLEMLHRWLFQLFDILPFPVLGNWCRNPVRRLSLVVASRRTFRYWSQITSIRLTVDDLQLDGRIFF